ARPSTRCRGLRSTSSGRSSTICPPISPEGGRIRCRRRLRSSTGTAVRGSTHAIHDGGDHWIVVGKVVALHRTACTSPLIFHGSRYANLGNTFESEILVSGF